MQIIEQFLSEWGEFIEERTNKEKEVRGRFLAMYPEDKISLLSLDDYLIAPRGYGNPNSFCYQIRYDLQVNSSMGNAWPSTFGIYLKGGKTITLDTKYRKKFGDNYKDAFEYIKKEISKLLEAGRNLDYKVIAECDLNSLFKYKLLGVYCLDLYLPAPASTALNAYCDFLGISYDPKDEMVIRNREAVQWKESVPELAQWDNIRFMLFCDWLWRSKRSINKKMFENTDYRKQAEDLDRELAQLQIEGEMREAVVKVRVNQNVFRDRLLLTHNKCCLCGVTDPSLLVASHIKPWAQSSPDEKLDENNGLLMCPNHDKLFDKGLITFDDTGKIIISDRLGENERVFMNVNAEMKVPVNERVIKYLQFHRKNIFC
ncbi:MAG: HNH endonuclease [Parasporobacterium sp.]|nr:HNH endonuclease [Parasporobacterium sp.]